MIDLSIPIVSLVLGALLLFLGRKLFWLFVAAAGFALGITATPHLMQHPPSWLALVAAVVLGLLGALIAFLVQKVAIGVAGFLAGGRLAVLFATAFVSDQAQYYWLTFLIGGVVGAVLLLVLFDWALIILSSAEGAHLIGEAVRFPDRGAGIFFIVLLAVGIIVQTAMFRRSSRS